MPDSRHYSRDDIERVLGKLVGAHAAGGSYGAMDRKAAYAASTPNEKDGNVNPVFTRSSTEW